jgi:hypothetical protein
VLLAAVPVSIMMIMGMNMTMVATMPHPNPTASRLPVMVVGGVTVALDRGTLDMTPSFRF